jgi:hypothetical protein
MATEENGRVRGGERDEERFSMMTKLERFGKHLEKRWSFPEACENP